MTLSPRKIMVGFHGTGQARDALCLGELLAGALHAAVLLAQVSRSGHGTARPERRSGFTGHLGNTSLAVRASSVARGLHDLAIANNASILVIGSAHGGSVGRILVGDVLSWLVHSPPCPVAVAPRGFAGCAGSLETIAVAFDGSDEARLAAADAADIALAAGATLRLIAVADTSAALYVDVERGGAEGRGSSARRGRRAAVRGFTRRSPIRDSRPTRSSHGRAAGGVEGRRRSARPRLAGPRPTSERPRRKRVCADDSRRGVSAADRASGARVATTRRG